MLGIYIAVLTLAGAQLFFEEQVGSFANLFAVSSSSVSAKENLTIVYAIPFESLEPTLFNAVDRSRLVDIYEGLVRTNQNLKIESSLALSWGLLNPVTWEFKLRPDVKFHNGKLLTPEDVVYSINRAMKFQGSQLKNLLNTITEVKIINDSTIHIITKQPDPLLLNKLAVTFIFSKDTKDFSVPVGTGPYAFVSMKDHVIVLKRFDAYWGKKPYYPGVVLATIPDRIERQGALENGKVQLLADVPPAATANLLSSDIQVTSIPSLEVNFLMFNLTDPFLMNFEVRDALSHVFDRHVFSQAANGFARPVGQFVSSGVFGFNPVLMPSSFDMNKAKKEMVTFYGDRTEPFVIRFDYPEGLDIVGQYVEDQFNQLGIEIKLNPLPDDELQKKIISGSSQMYFLGWRSELGDSADFLTTNIHSRDGKSQYGQFNGIYYYNPKVDRAIEDSQKTLDVKARLQLLQTAMKIAVQDDIVGIPLFESEKIFAFQKNVHFVPRVDGYIFASEIR